MAAVIDDFTRVDTWTSLTTHTMSSPLSGSSGCFHIFILMKVGAYSVRRLHEKLSGLPFGLFEQFNIRLRLLLERRRFKKPLRNGRVFVESRRQSHC